MHTTPPSLLERVRKPDDHQAWARFVDLYTPLIYFWACRMGMTAQDAGDFVQDVFTTLVEKMPGFVYDPGKSFRGWLRTLVVNKWRDKRRRLAHVPPHAGDAALEDVAGPEAEQFWDVEYRRHLADHALQLIQSEFQATTWKACWEVVVAGRPPAEVAEELGISLTAVYSAKSHVLRRLRQEMAGMLD
jgi:RNA polymerase sigma-70 factor (ECF subfamily)